MSMIELIASSSYHSWDISQSVSTGNSLSLSGHGTTPYGISFSDDGTVLFIYDGAGQTVYQWSLTNSFDITTASYASKSFSLATQIGGTSGQARVAKNGTKLYGVSYANNKIYQYTLGTPNDISTASYDSVSFDLSGTTSTNSALAFKFSPDGTKLYICNGIAVTTCYVFEFSLSSAWDISTLSYTSKYINVFAQINPNTNPRGIFFSPGGDKMYLSLNNTGGYQYALTTPWDLSTASYASKTYSFSGVDSNVKDFYLLPDTHRYLLCGNTNNKIFEIRIP